MVVPLPDREMLAAARKRAEEERASWSSHRSELTRRYPAEFVAVLNGEDIDHDRDLMVLARRLKDTGVRPNDAMIEFMATEPELYLL